MKVVVAGSRQVPDYWIVDGAIRNSGFVISRILEGDAPGVDRFARMWAQNNGVPFDTHAADWENREGRPGATMRQRSDGIWYDVSAGYVRNIEMARQADAAIIVWDWASRGTRHMLLECLKRVEHVFVYRTYDIGPRPRHTTSRRGMIRRSVEQE